MNRGPALVVLALLLLPSLAPASFAQAPDVPPPDAPATPPLPVEPPQLPALPDLPTSIVRLLQDLLGGANEAPEVVDHLAPGGTPDVGVVSGDVNAAVQEVREDAFEIRDEGLIRTLYKEGFEGPATLEERGWLQEVLRGEAPWGVLDARNHTVTRGTGEAFTPEFEGSANPLQAKDGRHAVTIVNAAGRYDRRIDARLVSPVLDLRYVAGQSFATDEAFLKIVNDPTLSEPWQQLAALWKLVPVLGQGTAWLFTTPPSEIARITGLNGVDNVCTGPVADPPLIGCALAANFFNPLQERFGVGLINLTFYHKYDLREVGDFPTFLDGTFLEIRVVHDDGTTGPWRLLLGDTLFEPTLNEGGFVGAIGNGFLGAARPSGLGETVAARLSGDNAYNPQFSPYNGRVQLQSPQRCATDPRCATDVPAWVAASGGLMVKSHFTLNGYAGQKVQVAWRVHSDSVSADEGFGWMFDAVRVEALLHARDPGVHDVAQPRAGDIVPTDAVIQPSAVIRNYGALAVAGLQVNFTIEEDTPQITSDTLRDAAQRDLDQAQADLAAGQAPTSPLANTTALVQGGAQPANVLMRSNATVPFLDGLQEVVVRSPIACSACVPGKYRLRVDVAAMPLTGGAPGSLPLDRIEDGNLANNNVTVYFQVRDVAAASLELGANALSVLTDLNEPKTFTIALTNLGNRALVGSVDLMAEAVDPVSLLPLPGGAEVPVGSVPIGPGDLPAGMRITSFGGDRDTFAANLTWTPPSLAPGAYRVEAVLHTTPAVLPLVTDAITVFIRTTPPAYYTNDFEGPVALAELREGTFVPRDLRVATDTILRLRNAGSADHAVEARLLPAPGKWDEGEVLLNATLNRSSVLELPLSEAGAYEVRAGPAGSKPVAAGALTLQVFFEDHFSRSRLPFVGFDTRGFRSVHNRDIGEVGDSLVGAKAIEHLTVSTNHTWDGVGTEGALLEASVLGLLAGPPFGLAPVNPNLQLPSGLPVNLQAGRIELGPGRIVAHLNTTGEVVLEVPYRITFPQPVIDPALVPAGADLGVLPPVPPVEGALSLRVPLGRNFTLELGGLHVVPPRLLVSQEESGLRMELTGALVRFGGVVVHLGDAPESSATPIPWPSDIPVPPQDAEAPGLAVCGPGEPLCSLPVPAGVYPPVPDIAVEPQLVTLPEVGAEPIVIPISYSLPVGGGTDGRISLVPGQLTVGPARVETGSSPAVVVPVRFDPPVGLVALPLVGTVPVNLTGPAHDTLAALGVDQEIRIDPGELPGGLNLSLVSVHFDNADIVIPRLVITRQSSTTLRLVVTPGLVKLEGGVLRTPGGDVPIGTVPTLTTPGQGPFPITATGPPPGTYPDPGVVPDSHGPLNVPDQSDGGGGSIVVPVPAQTITFPPGGPIEESVDTSTLAAVLGSAQGAITTVGDTIAKTFGQNFAFVTFSDEGICITAETPTATANCQPRDGCTPDASLENTYFAYDCLDRTIFAQQPDQPPPQATRSVLHDYYLGQPLDLRNTTCIPPACRPTLTFTHLNNFSWAGLGVDLTLPGAVGGPPKVPGGIEGVSPDQVSDDRSRGLVEATLLDAGPVPITRAPADLGPRDVAGLAGADVPSLCDTAGSLCEQTCLEPGTAGAGAGSLPLIGQWYDDHLGSGSACALRVADDPAATPVSLAAFTEPEHAWRSERIDLSPFVGHEIFLAFHLQTSLARKSITQDKEDCTTETPPLDQVDDPIGLDARHAVSSLACDLTDLEPWALDNIRLEGFRADGTLEALQPSCEEAVADLDEACGFFDSAGDVTQVGELQNLNWTRWQRFRTLRQAADANVALAPECFLLAPRPIRFDQPLGPGNAQSAAATCLTASQFTGPAGMVYDGRGWDIYLADAIRIEGSTADPNPHLDGWFVDETAGFQAAGTELGGSVEGLRWGGPGNGGTYPTGGLMGDGSDLSVKARSLYGIASTPLIPLVRASHPFAEFYTRYSFALDAAEIVPYVNESSGEDPYNKYDAHVDVDHIYRDGGTVYFARYAPDPATGRYVLDRSVHVVPEGGYPAYVGRDGGIAGMDQHVVGGDGWVVPGPDGKFVNNGLAKFSEGWERYRFDLLEAFQDLCLKREVTADGGVLRSFDADACADFNNTALYECSGNQCVSLTTGSVFEDVETPDLDTEGLYALEFHAMNGDGLHQASGWVVDNLVIKEQFLANDIGVSAILEPAPGRLVGPGQQVQLRANVTNYGYFPQRGFNVRFNVSQEGVQVFPPLTTNASVLPPGCDFQSCGQVTPLSQVLQGNRVPEADHNVTVNLETPWIPEKAGVYAITVWTELREEHGSSGAIPLRDEDLLNDRFTLVAEVREEHSVRFLTLQELPDDEVVQPFVGGAADARAVRIGLLNDGTMEEGTDGQKFLNLTLTIQREGTAAPEISTTQSVARVGPGRQAIVDFGARAWKPQGGGLYTLTFQAHLSTTNAPDPVRVVRVLVLTPLLPTEGQDWAAYFKPEGLGWTSDAPGDANLTTANGPCLERGGFGAWRFTRGDTYAPGDAGDIVLCTPVDLTTFRGAVLALRHRFDFERGYDGGVVEVSADGQTWEKITPLGGYPGNLTSSSPEVGIGAAAHAGCALLPASVPDCRAFTGASDGVITSVFPLGQAAAVRTDTVVLMRDTFDTGTLLLGSELADDTGQWVELVSRSPVAADGGARTAWWVDKRIAWRGGSPLELNEGGATPGPETIDRKSPLEGTKDLRSAPFRVPSTPANLLVEFDDWRALGLVSRDQSIPVPNTVEVFLEFRDGLGQLQRLPVVGRSATETNQYGDNYQDWTHRAIVIPRSQVTRMAGLDVQLVFRLNLANGVGSVSSAALAESVVQQDASGNRAPTGEPDDTDNLAAHLGWAVAHPQVALLSSREACAAANLTRPAGTEPLRFEGGRCKLRDWMLDYPVADAAAARADWGAAWSTTRRNAQTQLVQSKLDSSVAGGDPFVEAGWRLVEATGDPAGKPVWDLRAMSPANSGHGRAAEATGQGVDARLVAPVGLRAAVGAVNLTLDQSFKFTDLTKRSFGRQLVGGASGGRVEVSRDGGLTWEPVAPTEVLANGTWRSLNPDGSAVTHTTGTGKPDFGLAYVGYRRMFNIGATLADCFATPVQQVDLGCLHPGAEDELPGNWTAAAQDARWVPIAAESASTPFGGRARDVERDSSFGLGGSAFSGTTCGALNTAGSRLYDSELCEGPEGWQSLRFDLSKYAGEDILVGFHAWFTTHRHAVGDDLVAPDFWRVDNVQVDAPVLDGKPLLVRLRAFSDRSGEAAGWDVLNATILGDEHVRNLGVRIDHPAAGEPLALNDTIVAKLVNKGQVSAGGAGLLWVEQDGAEPAPLSELRNASFNPPAIPTEGEDWIVVQGTASPADPLLAAGDPTGKALAIQGTLDDPRFELVQNLTLPPGLYTLDGTFGSQKLTGGPEAPGNTSRDLVVGSGRDAYDLGSTTVPDLAQVFPVPEGARELQHVNVSVRVGLTPSAQGELRAQVVGVDGAPLSEERALAVGGARTAAFAGPENADAGWVSSILALVSDDRYATFPLSTVANATWMLSNDDGLLEDIQSIRHVVVKAEVGISNAAGAADDGFKLEACFQTSPDQPALTCLGDAGTFLANATAPAGSPARLLADGQDAVLTWDLFDLDDGGNPVFNQSRHPNNPFSTSWTPEDLDSLAVSIQPNITVARDGVWRVDTVWAEVEYEASALFNFTGARVPDGAAVAAVGFRSAALPMALLGASDVLEPGRLSTRDDGYLLGLDRASGQLVPREEDDGAVGHDLNVSLTFRRDGIVTFDVVGAEALGGSVAGLGMAGPLVLTQPESAPASPDGVPFSLDFVVPDQRPLQIRLRGTDWPGIAMLDNLHLARRSVAAQPFAGSMAPGASLEVELPLEGKPGATYAIHVAARPSEAAGGRSGEPLLGDNRAMRSTPATLGPGLLRVVSVDAVPNNVNLSLGQPVVVRMKVENKGGTEAEARELDVSILDPSGLGSVFHGSATDLEPAPESLVVEAGQTEEFRWLFFPPPTLPHGVYKLEGSLLQVGDDTRVDGKSRLYLGTDFNSQLGFSWPFFNATTSDDPPIPITDDLFFGLEQDFNNIWTSYAVWTPQAPCQDPSDMDVTHPCMWPGTVPMGSPTPDSTRTLSAQGCNWAFTKTRAFNLSAFRSITLGGDEKYPLRRV
ncbi:MAG TPA: hypothetical protein VGR28_04695, partial [Candidatus Thermoplasmatota archaeon]|nr:hypothetical protein [Candidatus Thermoplasmatota archaeon]